MHSRVMIPGLHHAFMMVNKCIKFETNRFLTLKGKLDINTKLNQYIGISSLKRGLRFMIHSLHGPLMMVNKCMKFGTNNFNTCGPKCKT